MRTGPATDRRRAIRRATLRRLLLNFSVRPGPLRRTGDRLEAALRVVGVVVMTAAVPLSVALGMQVDQHAAALQATQMATQVQVDAVVTGPTQDLVTGPVSRAGRAGVGWTGLDGAQHHDQIIVAAATHLGDVVPVWISRATSSLVPAPLETPPLALGIMAACVAGLACLAVVGTCWTCTTIYWAHRRDQSWQREWAALEPLWRTRGV